MNRNLLLIALFIFFCWRFKVFETKINTRNYFGKRNLKQLLQTSDYFKATIQNQSNNNSSLPNVFVSEISSINNESIGILPSEFPCKSEASNKTQFNFDKSKWDPDLEVFNKNSSKLKDEIDRTSNIVPFSSKELPHALEVTNDSYVDLNQLYLNRNYSFQLYGNDSNSENRTFVLVKDTISPGISFKKETFISNASNNSVITANGILESDTTAGIIDTVVTTKSPKRLNNFQDQFSNGDTSKEPNLTKPGSIKNRFQSHYGRKNGDNVQILNYIHETYDAVQGTFVKVEEVHQLVNELMLGIDQIQTKSQRLLSNVDETTGRLSETKCTFHGNLDQHQANLELLKSLKLNIDRSFFDVEEAMSDLAFHLTVYEELHQSSNRDIQLFETARAEIFKTMRTVNSLMNIVQKDSNRFLKYFPNFKILCN